MKKSVFSFIALFAGFSLNAQTVSTFEPLPLAADTFWDGSDQTFGFSDGNAYFPNTYDANWMYWSSGWAYSNVQDSSTSGYGNMYAAKAFTGYNASSNYILGQQHSRIILTGAAAGRVVSGTYVTNSTYAHNSMRDGDQFAKKFGGPSGNDPDYFKLTFRKYLGGVMTNDSVEFYLADYRFNNNAQDYIVNSWTWVDLSSLGNVDSLELILSSTDYNSSGILTPLFYCLDHFTTADSPLGLAENTNEDFRVYPNPAQNTLNLHVSTGSVSAAYLYNMNGELVKSAGANSRQLNIEDLAPGIYTLRIENGTSVHYTRITKI